MVAPVDYFSHNEVRPTSSASSQRTISFLGDILGDDGSQDEEEEEGGNALLTWGSIAVLSPVSVSMIVLGLIYYDGCPAQPTLPLFLLGTENIKKG